MNTAKAEKILAKLLATAGVHINGAGEADIKVNNGAFYNRVLTEGILGAGESYMEGWWDVERLDVFTEKVVSKDVDNIISSLTFRNKVLIGLNALQAKVFNFQKKSRSFKGGLHYNTGNELFSCMLDQRMMYSCAYWKNANNLEQAQRDKLDLICKKLYLRPGMRVLDIGCGWGGFAKFAAQNCGVSVVGVTVSKEQAKLAKEKCKGMPVEIRLQDYRGLNRGNFDAVVSVGMMEHVGVKNYRAYMEVARRNMKAGGLFLLQTIGGNTSVSGMGDWIGKYIFPNAMLPSINQISNACEGLFVIEDWHNFGPDYDKTLMAWFDNFNRHWGRLKKQYSETFYRMWKFYLLTCAGAFRARRNQLWQVVLSDGGVRGGYVPVR